MDYKRAYEEEMDRQYWERERELQDRIRERERIQQERRERQQQQQYHAASWEEALLKNASRCEQEAHQLEDDDGFSYADFFGNLARMNRDAHAFLLDERRFIAPIVNRLRRMIAALEQRARKRAYMRVIEKYPDQEYETLNPMIKDESEPSDILWW